MDVKYMPRLIMEDVKNELDLIKSIQLYIKEEPFLVLGKKNHGVMLDQILEYMGINFNKVTLNDDSYHAEKQGDLYIAVGMGGCFKYENMIKIRNNKNFEYGIGPDYEHLEKIKPYLSDFKLLIGGDFMKIN
jgi:hypothetical protein